MPSWQMWDSGVYSTLPGGTCIGTTHFAAYDNRMLNELEAKLGIDLRSYYWREIPKTVQKELTRRKQVKAVYDTGKLANILLDNRGRSLELTTAPALTHLGGISVSVQRKSSSLPGTLGRLLRGTLGKVHLLQGEVETVRESSRGGDGQAQSTGTASQLGDPYAVPENPFQWNLDSKSARTRIHRALPRA